MCSSCILSKTFVSFVSVRVSLSQAGSGPSKQIKQTRMNSSLFMYWPFTFIEANCSFVFVCDFLLGLNLTLYASSRKARVSRSSILLSLTHTYTYTYTHIVQRTAIEFCRLVLYTWKRHHLALPVLLILCLLL